MTGGPPEAAAVAAIPPSPPTLRKRDSKCDGFNIESSVPSTSQTVQVSNIVDCINGAESGCTITVGSEHTESVSTSYSLSAGGGIEGIFSVEATFGMEYTESSTTSLQEGFSVQQGQKGYLAAYSAATLFRGTYTGCDEGDAEQPGEALVIKKEGCKLFLSLEKGLMLTEHSSYLQCCKHRHLDDRTWIGRVTLQRHH